MNDYVLIGKVIKVRSPRGDLKVESFSDIPNRFASLRSARFRKSGYTDVVEWKIEKARSVNDYVVMKLENVDSYDDALQFVGADILVDETDRPEPPEGSYYIDSLAGMSVLGSDGRSIGKVTGFISNSNQSLLSVQTHNGTETFIPFVKQFVKMVDAEKRTIRVEVIEGLIEEAIDED